MSGRALDLLLAAERAVRARRADGRFKCPLWRTTASGEPGVLTADSWRTILREMVGGIVLAFGSTLLASSLGLIEGPTHTKSRADSLQSAMNRRLAKVQGRLDRPKNTLKAKSCRTSSQR